MTMFKTSKEIARGFLLVTGTFILAGLYFIPLITTLTTAQFEYLSSCHEKYEIIYTLLVTFYLNDIKNKIQNYLEERKS